jgi:hypothetical protein
MNVVDRETFIRAAEENGMPREKLIEDMARLERGTFIYRGIGPYGVSLYNMGAGCVHIHNGQRVASPLPSWELGSGYKAELSSVEDCHRGEVLAVHYWGREEGL